MQFTITLNEIVSLFLLILAGAVFGKLKLASEKFQKDLNALVFNITLPCTLVQSMLIDFSSDILYNMMWIAILSFATIFVCSFFGKFMTPIFKPQDRGSYGVYRFAFVFSNFGFMGLPVCYTLFGETGLLYAAVWGVPCNLMFFIYAASVYNEGKGKGKLLNAKVLLTPVNISMVIGLILFCLRIKLPTALDTVVNMFSACTTPLAMFLAGMLLSASSVKTIFTNYKLYFFAALRLVVMPAIAFVILHACGFTGLSLAIPVVMIGMPVAANTTVVTQQFDGNGYLCAQLIFITTLLSIITIPFLAYFLI